MSAESVHVHAPEPHVPALLQSLSTVHTNPVEGKEKIVGYAVNLDCNMEGIALICFKSQLCSILQTKECPKIQKAVGSPTAHIFRLTSCPK